MDRLQAHINSVTAFAPATCGNIAVGFDILGAALAQPGDEVTLTRRNDDKIVITHINSHKPLPLESYKNTASVALQALLDDLKLTVGFDLSINKGIDIGSGMGGSAASAVAAVVAANAFLQQPLSNQQLIPYALQGELLASGTIHPDNVVPSLIGGLVLTHSLDPIALIKLPLTGYYWIVIHPDLQISTKTARELLKSSLSLTEHTQQSAKLAAFIAAIYCDDPVLLKASLVDIIVEPVRAPLIPGFYDLKATALAMGALGASISGAGPSLFALANNEQQAHAISHAMVEVFAKHKIAAQAWISPSQTQGAAVKYIKE